MLIQRHYIYSRRHNKVSVPFLLPFRFLVVLPFLLPFVTVYNRSVFSLPVAPLALPECSSAFDVHTIDLEPRGQQVRSRRIFTASVFLVTVFAPFKYRFTTVFDTVFSTVMSPFSNRSPCNANGTETLF